MGKSAAREKPLIFKLPRREQVLDEDECWEWVIPKEAFDDEDESPDLPC